MAINRVIIEGNLTRDVEMRATASGLAVAGFTVAVNEKRKNAEGEYVPFSNIREDQKAE